MKIALLGAPVNLGSNRKCPKNGPEILRKAGILRGIQKHKVVDFGDISQNFSKSNPKNIKYINATAELNTKLALKVKSLKDKGYFPLVLGGDHSISIGVLAGTAIKGKKQSVLWVDAHPDFNTPATTPSGKIHGMGLAVSSGLGYKKLIDIRGFHPKIDLKLSAALGTRSIDTGEKELISKHKLKVHSVKEINLNKMKTIIERVLQNAKNADMFHLSIDLDFLDPSIAPGVCTPVPQGIFEKDALKMCRMIRQANIMSSCDITELDPLKDKDGKTAKLVCKLVRELFL